MFCVISCFPDSNLCAWTSNRFYDPKSFRNFCLNVWKSSFHVTLSNGMLIRHLWLYVCYKYGVYYYDYIKICRVNMNWLKIIDKVSQISFSRDIIRRFLWSSSDNLKMLIHSGYISSFKKMSYYRKRWYLELGRNTWLIFINHFKDKYVFKNKILLRSQSFSLQITLKNK